MLAKLIDLKSTFEGRFLAVVLSALLATSMVNLTAFASEGDDAAKGGEATIAGQQAEPAPTESVPVLEPEPASSLSPAPAQDPAPAPESAPVLAPDPAPPAPNPAPGPTTGPEPSASSGSEANVLATDPATGSDLGTVDVVQVTFETDKAFVTVEGTRLTSSTLSVPLHEELVFIASPNDGYVIDSIKVKNAANADVPVTTHDGTSKIDAGFVDDTLVITVKAVEAPAEETPEIETTPLANDAKIEADGEATEEEAPSILGAAIARGTSNGESVVVEVGQKKVITGKRAPQHTWVIEGSSEHVKLSGVSKRAVEVEGKTAGTATVKHGTRWFGFQEWAWEYYEITVVPKKVTVTFDANGGTGASQSFTTTQTNITLPSLGTGEGQIDFAPPSKYHTFIGWSADSSGKVGVYSANQLYPDNPDHNAHLTGNVTLYAVWLDSREPAPKGVTAYFFVRTDGQMPFEPSGYSISSYAPSGSATTLQGKLRQPIAISNNLSAVAGNLAEIPSNETIKSVIAKDGVRFDPTTQEIVWYVIKQRVGEADKWNVDGVIKSKSMNWVRYDPNGGAGAPDGMQFTKGETVNVIFNPAPVRPGFIFLGWDESPAATNPAYQSKGTTIFSMPGKDVTLYAAWQEDDKVRYNYEKDPAAGGTLTKASESLKPATGTAVGSEAAANDGYTFDAWYSSDGVKITPANAADFNVTITDGKILPIKNTEGVYTGGTFTAKFTPNNDQLIYDKNAPDATGTMDPTKGKVGQDVTVAANSFVRGGYAFVGWNTAANGSGVSYAAGETYTLTAGIDVLYAQWEADFSDLSAKGFEEFYDGKTYRVAVTGTLPTDTVECWVGGQPLPANEFVDVVSASVTVKVVRSGATAKLDPVDAVIKPRPVSLASANDAKTYDGTPLVNEDITVGNLGFVPGEEPEFNVTGTATNVVDTKDRNNTFTYAFPAGVSAGNYDITQTFGTLTVAPAPLTVTADNPTKVAGESDPVLTYTFTKAASGETPNFSGALEREAGEGVGSYAINQGTLALADDPGGRAADTAFKASNYLMSFVPGVFTITAAPVPPVPPVPPTPTPPVTPPATPATPATPPAVPLGTTPADTPPTGVPAAEVIESPATPLAGPQEQEIGDNENPLAGFDRVSCWVHYYLILGIILTVLYGAGVLARRINFTRKLKKREDEVLGIGSEGAAAPAAPAAAEGKEA